MPSPQELRLAILARAYGMPEDVSAVVAAIYERLYGATHITFSVDPGDGLPAEWRAIATVVVMLILDRQGFARVRGGGRPPKALRISMA